MRRLVHFCLRRLVSHDREIRWMIEFGYIGTLHTLNFATNAMEVDEMYDERRSIYR